MPTQHPIDTEGRPIGPLRFRRAAIINFIGGGMICIAVVVMFPGSAIGRLFLYDQLGASRTEVGLAEAAGQLAVLLSLPGAWFFNRLRARRGWWVVLMTFGRSFLFVVAAAAALSADPALRPMLVAVVIWSIFVANAIGSFTGPAWQAWMADLIPESIRGTFFSQRQGILVLCMAFGSIVASAFIERFDAPGASVYFIVFLICAVLAVIDPILFWWVPEPRRPKQAPKPLREVASLYIKPLVSSQCARLIWPTAVQQFLVMLPMASITLYRAGDLAGTESIGCFMSMELIVMVNAIWLVSVAIVARKWGNLADRVGHRTVYIISSTAHFTNAVYFFLNWDNFWWILPIQVFLHALLSAGNWVAWQNMAMAVSPRAEREYYLAAFAAVFAGAGAMGSALGGWLADAMPILHVQMPNGQSASYLHILLAISFVGTLANMLFLLRVPDVKQEALRPWFGRLVTGGLIRTLWAVDAIGPTSSPSRRIRAMRTIRASDGNLMLKDVADTLEDPDPTVRREAILALGRIGSDEATELLLWHLHEPDSSTRIATAEALGQVPAPGGSRRLRGALTDHDRDVRRAAAEALGGRPDAGATDDLLRLLERERDADVLVSAADALSRLGEFRAVRALLVMSLENPNRRVRNQIVVAMGNLLGPPAEFYKLWQRERKAPGSAASYLAGRLRRQARLIRHDSITPKRRRVLRTRIRQNLEVYVDSCQQEAWPEATAAIRDIAAKLLRLRYNYRGHPDHTFDFLGAVDPVLAHRYWLVGFLDSAARRHASPDAPWTGLTLLSAWALIHGQPPT